jgi:hypothetical protein
MTLKKTTKDSNKIIKGIDKTAATVSKQSKRLYNKAIDDVIKKTATKKPFTANSLVAKDIDNNLQKILNSTDKSYDQFIKAQESFLASNYSVDLTKAELNILVGKKSDLLDELVTNTTILKEDVKAIIFANLGKGVPKSELVSLLKDLYPAYARNAGTIINTGISKTYIDTNVAKFKQLDFNWYLYAGPDDAITRDIPCKHWVWHKFPASQLDTVAATRLSLWNCRHNIIAITDEEAKNYPLLDLSFA